MLSTRKTDLKETLVNSYSENVDYIVQKSSPMKKAGGALKKDVFITNKCFKLLAMNSKSSNSKVVRTYFFELEEALNQYKDCIAKGLNDHILSLKGKA